MLRRVFAKPGLFKCRRFSTSAPLLLLHAKGPVAGTATLESFRPLTGRVELDYAKSSRSNCAMCGFGITEKSLRIGTYLQGAGDFAITVWQHPRCFRSMTSQIYPDLLTCTDPDISFEKVHTIEVAERDTLAKTLTNDESCSWKALLNGGLFPVEADYLAFDQQLQAISVAKTALECWSLDELCLLFDANVSDTAGSQKSSRKPDRDVMAAKVGTMLLFGPTAPCTVCKGGELVSNNASGNFVCRGHFDAFTKCGTVVAADAIVRVPLVVPPKLLECVDAFHTSVAAALKLRDARAPKSHAPLFDKPLMIGHAVKRAVALWSTKKQAGTQSSQDGQKTLPKKGKASRNQKPQSSSPPAAVQSGSVAGAPFAGLTFAVEDATANFDAPPWSVIGANGSTVVKADAFLSRVAKAKDALVWDGTTHLVSDPPHSSDALIPTIRTEWVLESAKVCRPLTVREGYSYYKETRRPPAADTKWIEKIEKHTAVQQANSAAMGAGSAGSASASPAARSVAFSGDAPVDPESGLAGAHTVYHSPDDLPYSVTLSSVDLGTDKNSFYVLQLLHDKDAAAATPYVVFRRWGRLGDPLKGGMTVERTRDAQSATNKFAKYFFDRTDNSWWPFNIDHVKKFVKKPGKYNWVDRPHEADEDLASAAAKSKTAGLAAASPPSVTLPQENRNLMRLLFNEESIQRSMATMSIDTTKMPLPGLNARAVKDGRTVLHELLKAVDPSTTTTVVVCDGDTNAKAKKSAKGSKGKVKVSDVKVAEPAGHVSQHQRHILSLSNQFYSHIPHIRSTDSADAFLLNSMEKISSKFQLLDDLEDILLTKRMMIQQSRDSHDPQLEQFQRLGIDLVPLSTEADEEAQLICKYFENSHGATHSKYKLKQLWTLSRHGEDTRFDPWKAFPNRKLLWHGSRLTNWVRILSTGLKIAPPDAPVSGYMFGKGIYFADMVSKSANYCHMYGGAEGGLLALAEVALGTPTLRYSSDFITALPKDTHSTYALGRTMPDPAKDVKLPSGLVVPAGGPIKQPNEHNKCTLLYNEFIVYDVSQVRLKYLLHVERT